MESLKLILLIILISFFNPSFSDPHSSLDTLIHNYVDNNISFSPTSPRTGVIRNLTLPSLNSSAIQLSVVRLRSGSLWVRGKNISAFQIPSMIIPIPYVKRLVLVTSNLSLNLSSHYNFTPPQGYVFASPVMGLAVYNASTTSFVGNTSVTINVSGGPIFVTFDNVDNDNNVVCVGFDGVGEGKVLGTMTKPGQCSVYREGYFATAVRDTAQGSSGSGSSSSKDQWVVGVVIVVGVLVMIFVGILVMRMVKRKRIEEMERQSEKEVGVGRMWVGQSRLPTGNTCRTQPQLESEMLP